MRSIKYVFLPALLMLLLVAMPLAETAIATEPAPLATPVTEESMPGEGAKEESVPMTADSGTFQPLEWDDPTVKITPPETLYGLPHTDNAFEVSYDFTGFPLGGPENEVVFVMTVSHWGVVDSYSLSSHAFLDESGRISTQTLSVAGNEDLAQHCLLNRGIVKADIRFHVSTVRTGIRYEHPTQSVEIPCTAEITPVAPQVTRPNNDGISIPPQPAGITVSDTGWVNSKRTITFIPAAYAFFPEGFQTVYHYVDGALPYPSNAPVPPVHTELCGPNNDDISVPDQPEGITQESDTGWQNGTRVITFSAHEEFDLPDGFDLAFSYTDGNSACLVSVFVTAESGAFMDRKIGVPVPVEISITLAHGHPYDSVNFTPSQETCSVRSGGGSLAVTPGVGGTFTASPSLPTTEDERDCHRGLLFFDLNTSVYGSTNGQEDQSSLIQNRTRFSTSWAREITPFPTRPVLEQPPPGEVCDSDENTECLGSITSFTVQLISTDGTSLEGAPWQLYAPVASQDFGTEPFAEGTVGEGNTIVVQDLIAGQYRLVVDADGYEQIDTVFTVRTENQTQEIRLDVTALQPVQSPTPVPAYPGSTTTSESPGVTGLPETGSGSGGGFGIMALAGMLAATVIGFIGNRRRINA